MSDSEPQGWKLPQEVLLLPPSRVRQRCAETRAQTVLSAGLKRNYWKASPGNAQPFPTGLPGLTVRTLSISPAFLLFSRHSTRSCPVRAYAGDAGLTFEEFTVLLGEKMLDSDEFSDTVQCLRNL